MDCIICNSGESTLLYEGIKKCLDCGHVYANLSMSDEDLKKLYENNYFFGEEYSDYLQDKAVTQRNFKSRLKVLNNIVGDLKSKSLHEIGCAFGFFLDLAQHHYEKVSGVDVSTEGIKYAKNNLNLNVKEEDFPHSSDTTSHDVFCMWDTIEHLKYPNLFIKKISENITDQGVLTITTGDINSINARLRKSSWRLIHPPTHIHYFTKKSLTQLLDKYHFDVVYFEHCGFHRSFDTLLYSLFVLKYNNLKFIYNACKKLKITNLNFYLNLFDIMYVVARKRSKF
jgi:SAM-dependent methyltransferase